MEFLEELGETVAVDVTETSEPVLVPSFTEEALISPDKFSNVL